MEHAGPHGFTPAEEASIITQFFAQAGLPRLGANRLRALAPGGLPPPPPGVAREVAVSVVERHLAEAGYPPLRKFLWRDCADPPAALRSALDGAAGGTWAEIVEFAALMASLSGNLTAISLCFEQSESLIAAADLGTLLGELNFRAALAAMKGLEKAFAGVLPVVNLTEGRAVKIFSAKTRLALVAEITRGVNAAYLRVNAVNESTAADACILRESDLKSAAETIRAGRAEISAAIAAVKELSEAFSVRE